MWPYAYLPVDFDDTKTLLSMDLIHRDPFDRMIIAQAKTTGSTVLTKDRQFKNYDIKVLW